MTAAGALLLAVDDSDVSPGVLGFLVVAGLGVATWLLLRSMRRQMKKIDFDEDAGPGETPTGPAGPTEPTGPTGPASPVAPSDERPGGSVS